MIGFAAAAMLLVTLTILVKNPALFKAPQGKEATAFVDLVDTDLHLHPGELLGLPVSTAQVPSSGVAGTMAANGSGLQWATVRNLLLAWVLTLPASILLSRSLFWLFRFLF
jgi:phosphate/sulfate permease